MEVNAARDVPYFPPSAVGFAPWGEDDVARFEAKHAVGNKARLALALIPYTGQRRSDVVGMGPQHVRNGWMTFTQLKNRKKPVTLSTPVHPELARTIAETPKSGALAYLIPEFGEPFTANGFGNKFRD